MNTLFYNQYIFLGPLVNTKHNLFEKQVRFREFREIFVVEN